MFVENLADVVITFLFSSYCLLLFAVIFVLYVTNSALQDKPLSQTLFPFYQMI